MAANRFRRVSWNSGNGFVAVSCGTERNEAPIGFPRPGVRVRWAFRVTAVPAPSSALFPRLTRKTANPAFGLIVSRACSSSQNAQTKQAPRQSTVSTNKRVWSTFVNVADMNAALQHTCHQAWFAIGFAAAICLLRARYRSSGPILTFGRVPTRSGCKCWNRTTKGCGYCGAPSTTKVRNFAVLSRIGRISLNAAELRYAWNFSRLSHC
jgi:hypothetical protein